MVLRGHVGEESYRVKWVWVCHVRVGFCRGGVVVWGGMGEWDDVGWKGM